MVPEVALEAAGEPVLFGQVVGQPEPSPVEEPPSKLTHTHYCLHPRRHRPDRRVTDHQPSGKPPSSVKQHVGAVRDDVFWFGRLDQVVIDVEPPFRLLKRDRRLLDPVRAAGRDPDVGGIVPAREAPLRGTRDASTL